MPALLYSLSEPGPNVPEAEFHDWYDNDHIPARIASPVFQSWARYVAADGVKPTYANIYDLESYDATNTPAYTGLAKNRSAHELDVIKRIEHLEPRVFEQLPADPIVPPSALYDPKKPAPYVLFLTMDIDDPEFYDGLIRWTKEEWNPHLATLPGWIRTRNYRLRDWKRLGAEGSKDQTAPHTYLTVVDLASPDVIDNHFLIEPPQTPLYEEVTHARTSRQARFTKLLKKFERQ